MEALAIVGFWIVALVVLYLTVQALWRAIVRKMRA